jgi:hypothetical protein
MTYNRLVRRGAPAAGLAIALLFASGAKADPPYSGGYGSPISGFNPGSSAASSAASSATQSIIQGSRDDAGRDVRTRSIVRTTNVRGNQRTQ